MEADEIMKKKHQNTPSSSFSDSFSTFFPVLFSSEEKI